MALFANLVVSPLPCIPAFATPPPPFFSDKGVFWRKFMPMLAMRHSALFGPRRLPPTREAGKIVELFGADTIRKVKPAIRTGLDGVRLKLVFLGQLGKHVPFTINRKIDRISLVPEIFLVGDPSAIRRLIVPVHINPIYLKSRRSIAHVVAKIDKAMLPPIANLNPAPAVMSVLRRIRVVASLFHPSPYMVVWVRFFKRHFLSPKVVISNNTGMA